MITATTLAEIIKCSQVVRALFRALNAMDNFQLAAVDSLAGSARSLLLALATASGHLDADVAVKAMRVEEDYQVGGMAGHSAWLTSVCRLRGGVSSHYSPSPILSFPPPLHIKF